MALVAYLGKVCIMLAPTVIGVYECSSDTLTVNAEVSEATGILVSDATAKALASWYVSTPTMAEFATGKSVNALKLSYDVADLRKEYWGKPDEYSSQDLVNVGALLAWVNSRLAVAGSDRSGKRFLSHV